MLKERNFYVNTRGMLIHIQKFFATNDESRFAIPTEIARLKRIFGGDTLDVAIKTTRVTRRSAGGGDVVKKSPCWEAIKIVQ